MLRPKTVSIVGFDSAWTNNLKSPGAVCAIRVDHDSVTFRAPSLACFDNALLFIREEQAAADLCLVALDQPTIVPNATSMRPVDRVVASVISWLGGGVQPANRSKTGMFDDAAPIWSFKRALDAVEDPELARIATHGLFLMEVFPALALASFEIAFFGRLKAPRYNPARRKTFRIADWWAVIAAVRIYAARAKIAGAEEWLNSLTGRARPHKSDQDKLDSLVCALVGYHWLVRERCDSIMIGDLSFGYMVAPVTPETLLRIRAAGQERSVLIA